jgi:hypothetical protein
MRIKSDGNLLAFVLRTLLVAAVSLASTATRRAEAATVTVSSTCTFAKAVAKRNAQANQSPSPAWAASEPATLSRCQLVLCI